MNLIELVEQARAVVRVWDGDRLVAVVPVRYPEMCTCSYAFSGVCVATHSSN